MDVGERVFLYRVRTNFVHDKYIVNAAFMRAARAFVRNGVRPPGAPYDVFGR